MNNPFHTPAFSMAALTSANVAAGSSMPSQALTHCTMR